jgi:hypothetical protein
MKPIALYMLCLEPFSQLRDSTTREERAAFRVTKGYLWKVVM